MPVGGRLVVDGGMEVDVMVGSGVADDCKIGKLFCGVLPDSEGGSATAGKELRITKKTVIKPTTARRMSMGITKGREFWDPDFGAGVCLNCDWSFSFATVVLVEGDGSGISCFDLTFPAARSSVLLNSD